MADITFEFDGKNFLVKSFASIDELKKKIGEEPNKRIGVWLLKLKDGKLIAEDRTIRQGAIDPASCQLTEVIS
ncbi:MAG: hypothetical protein V1692_02410 [bacterium]